MASAFEQGKKQMELALNGTIEQYEHHAKCDTPLSRELGNVVKTLIMLQI